MVLYRWLEWLGEKQFPRSWVYRVTEPLKVLVLVVWVARLK